MALRAGGQDRAIYYWKPDSAGGTPVAIFCGSITHQGVGQQGGFQRCNEILGTFSVGDEPGTVSPVGTS